MSKGQGLRFSHVVCNLEFNFLNLLVRLAGGSERVSSRERETLKKYVLDHCLNSLLILITSKLCSVRLLLAPQRAQHENEKQCMLRMCLSACSHAISGISLSIHMHTHTPAL